MKGIQNKTGIITAGSFLFGILFTVLFSADIQPLFSFFVINWISVLLFLVLLVYMVGVSLKIFPRQKHKFKHLLILIPLTVLLAAGILFLREYMLSVFTNSGEKLTQETIAYIAVITAVFSITCLEGIEFFSYWKHYIIHSEKIEKANLLAQYEALRDQLNPHFLFNGLNTLILFIENKDDRAAPFAQKMADFMKYLLTYQKDKLVTLDQELQVVKQYIYLQDARFEGNFSTTIAVNDNYMSSCVPPLAIQMLIENAIKHNKISSKYPLHIQINQQEDYIFVKNNKQLKDEVNSAGVGINNIKGRYRLFTGREVVIDENDQYFTIGVPLLNCTV